MRKIILLSIGIALMASCSVKTNEEKARELIEPDIKEHLIKPECYEFANLQLDSCFSDDARRNPDVCLFLMKASNLYKEYKEYAEEAQRAESYMTIYESSYGYQSAHSKLQENKYRAEMEKAQRKAATAKEKILQLYKENKQLLVDVNSGKHEFIGWKALIGFRTETAGGTKILAGYMYFLNKDISEITLRITEDDIKEATANNLEDITYEFEEDLREIFKDIR